MSIACPIPPARDAGPLPLSLSIARTHADLARAAWDIDGDWQRAPMQQWIWSQAAAETVDVAAPLQILTLREAGEVVAAAPLTRRRRRGVRQLEMLGVGQLHEPADLVWRDSRDLQSLAQAIVDQGRPVLLGRVPAESPSIAALERACHGRAIVIRRPQANCPVIPLDESWREPEQHLNAGRRSDLRRARRKAEQQGPVTSEIFSPSSSDVQPLLDEAFHIEASNWKGEEKTALAYDPGLAEFFRHYAVAAAETGSLRICFLKIGERRAAMQLAVETGGGFWLLKVGYDAQFAACSPGLLLMRDTIAAAAERGLASYEFLGKSDRWTQVWTEHERAHISLRIYPLKPGGIWALGCDLAAKYWHDWRGR